MPHLSASDMPAKRSSGAVAELSAGTSPALLAEPSFPIAPRELRRSEEGPAVSAMPGWAKEGPSSRKTDVRRASSSAREGMPSESRAPRWCQYSDSLMNKTSHTNGRASLGSASLGRDCVQKTVARPASLR